jgi:Fe-coproporphyrin III synthase
MSIEKLNLVRKLFNRFWLGNKNIILNSLGQKLRPRWIWFGVTDRCNSHCTHCNIWNQEPTSNPLTLEEIKKALSDPLLKQVETITNSGGEAILRNDIVEIIKLEHQIFPKASLDLSTNGIAADRVIKVVQEIMEENIKINVGISLDGLGEKHDNLRGVPGNFEKVDYLINKLLEIRKRYPDKLSLVVGFTLSDLTLDEWQKVKKYTDDKAIDFMMQWYNQSSFYQNKKTEVENNEKMVAAVSSQANTIIREKWLKLLGGRPIKFKCFAALSFFALRCDGGVVPCLNYWDSVLGNVREHTPSEIWNSKQAEKIRQKIKHCPGCLNSWGVEWSMTTAFYPRLMFYLRNLSAVAERLKRHD